MTKLDGGFGWLVVLCCVYGHLASVAPFMSFGVFLPQWVEDFDANRGLVSWVTALGPSVNCIIGPLVSSMVESYGYRPVMITGIVIASSAIFLSAFATSVYLLVVLIGVIGGFGIGMFFLPSISIISLVFDKRHALALSIVLSGSAVGNFLYPPFLIWLEDRMHWRGALIVMSGIMLHMVVFGALLRPEDLHPNTAIREHGSQGSLGFETRKDSVASTSYFQPSGLETNPVIVDKSMKSFNLGSDVKDNSFASLGGNSQFSSQSNGTERENIRNWTEIQNHTPQLNNDWGEDIEISQFSLSSVCGQATIIVRKLNISNVNPHIRVSDKHSFGTSTSPSNHCLTTEIKTQPNNSGHLRNIDIPVESQRRQIGSTYNDTNFTCTPSNSINVVANSSPANLLPPVTISPSKTMHESSSFSCRGWFSHLKLALALLKNPFFAVFAVSNFLTYLTFLMVPVYISDRAIESGVDKTNAALALSMYGAGNLLGRLGSGILSDRCNVDAFILDAVCLIVCGVSTCLSPLCGGNAVLHGLYGFTFGTGIGANMLLVPVILVKLLGGSMVSSSLGVIFTFRAMGMILGTPVAGWIYDSTGSYTSSFIIHGSIIGVSGLIIVALKVALVRITKHADAATDDAHDATTTKNVGVINDAFVFESSHETPNTVISSEL